MAEPEGHVFDEAGAKRVVAAVRKIEKIPTDLRQPRRRGGRGGVGVGTSSNPKQLLPLEADLETETAQTDTWDRNDQGDNDGFKIWRQTREAYNDAGDEKMYAFYREFVCDSTGNVKTVSAETRKETDAPDICT